MTVVYSLSSSKDDSRIRYVGVTRRSVSSRLSEHISCSRRGRTAKDKWIKSVLSGGHSVIASVIFECDCDDMAFLIEVEMIAKIGSSLVNGTAGGEGFIPLNEESRRKLSLSVSKSRNDDFRRRAREWRTGVVATKETREKQSMARKGRKFPATTRANIMSGPKSSSGFKGVTNVGSIKTPRYRSAINTGSGQRYIGYFSDPIDAAKSYDKEAFAAWGFDCFLNFPDEFKSAIDRE